MKNIIIYYPTITALLCSWLFGTGPPCALRTRPLPHQAFWYYYLFVDAQVSVRNRATFSIVHSAQPHIFSFKTRWRTPHTNSFIPPHPHTSTHTPHQGNKDTNNDEAFHFSATSFHHGNRCPTLPLEDRDLKCCLSRNSFSHR